MSNVIFDQICSQALANVAGGQAAASMQAAVDAHTAATRVTAGCIGTAMDGDNRRRPGLRALFKNGFDAFFGAATESREQFARDVGECVDGYKY